MNLSSFASSLASAADNLLPEIVPGAGAAIAIGKGLIRLINDVKPHVAGTSAGSQLDDSLTNLEERVSAHADSVEEELGDGAAT